MLQSSSLIDSVCKKKDVKTANHMMRGFVAAEIMNSVKVLMDNNIRDFLTDSLECYLHLFQINLKKDLDRKKCKVIWQSKVFLSFHQSNANSRSLT